MDQPGAVRGGETIGHFNRNPQGVGQRQAPFRQSLTEQLPFELLHDQERLAVDPGELEESADARMAQRRERARFAREPALRFARPRRSAGQDLDCDRTIDARVAGLVHLAHATGTEGAEDFVRAESGSRGERQVE